MNASVLPARLRRGVGAAVVIGAAVTGPVLVAGPASAAELPGIRYSCGFLEGDPDSDDPDDAEFVEFADPWIVTVRADLPASLKPGQQVTDPAFSASIKLGADAVGALRDYGVNRLDDGASLHLFTAGAAERTAGVEFDNVPVTIPRRGNVTLSGAGSGESFRAGKSGEVTVRMGDVLVAAAGEDGGFFVECEPLPGQNLTLARIPIRATATPSPTTKPTAPAPTTTKPAPSTSTGITSRPVQPTTHPGSSSQTSGVTGPPVQTDGLGNGTNAGALAAGAAALLTLGAAVGCAARSLRRQD